MSPLYFVLLCLPAMAFAANLQPLNLTVTAMYLDLDTNLNGNIDRHEIDESFRTYDSNNNGRISRTEYTNFVTSHEPTLLDLSHALYDVYDVDSDDQLDHHDFDNFYSLMDGNADGVVSHFEFSRYWTILLTNLAHLHSQKKK